jgi:hypothetical protein
MEGSEFLRRYARSPWGIASVFVALGAGAVSAALGAGIAGGLGMAAAAAAACFALGLGTGLGQRAASAEGDREATGRAAERIAAAAEARSRLALLRLPGGKVADARDLLVLEAGRLAESFARSGAYDPQAAQAVHDALALVDSWMKERDEASTERRFGLPDADPFPQAEERTAAALREKAALIASRRAAASGEIPPADLMAIEEELK